MINRQSSLGVSMCPMLAWEREDKGLELPCPELELPAGWKRPAAPSVRTLPGSAGSAWDLRLWDQDVTPQGK